MTNEIFWRCQNQAQENYFLFKTCPDLGHFWMAQMSRYPERVFQTSEAPPEGRRAQGWSTEVILPFVRKMVKTKCSISSLQKIILSLSCALKNEKKHLKRLNRRFDRRLERRLDRQLYRRLDRRVGKT